MLCWVGMEINVGPLNKGGTKMKHSNLLNKDAKCKYWGAYNHFKRLTKFNNYTFEQFCMHWAPTFKLSYLNKNIIK